MTEATQDDRMIRARGLALDLMRATEAAAIAAARFVGRGDERAADLAASQAVRDGFATTPMRGRVAVGADPNPDDGLFRLGDAVGMGEGPEIDIAMTPLEGATICAVGAPNAAACMAFARRGGLLGVPPVYMEKIAVGPDVPPGCVSLERDPADTVRAVAEAKGVCVTALTVCVLDRPRNEDLIARLREAGCRLTLILDGDVSGAVAAGLPETGVDVYMGSGGAAEGVLAAAGLRCLGGTFHGRLLLRNAEDRALARDFGFDRPDTVLTIDDLVPGDAMFAATGVTDGTLLRGVRFTADTATTQTLVLSSRNGSRRTINAVHRLSMATCGPLTSLEDGG